MVLDMNTSKINLDKTIQGHVQKKWYCPSCNKKRFVRFYNFDTNEYLDAKYGRCDREENCGHFFSPWSDPESQLKFEPREASDWQQPAQVDTTVFVDRAIFERTLAKYENNTLVTFLEKQCGFADTMSAVFKYFVGTAQNNGTIFWQIDQFKRVRTGTKIHYDETGHRVKSIEPKKLFLQKDDYRSCFFGEHLLFDMPRNSYVALVESEKSALISSLYMPTLGNRPVCWLATSGSNGITSEKIAPLRDRDIILVPDFSFHARATWGQVPMRKAKNDKGVMVPHPDGEIQSDFISAKTKLEQIGCRVKFWDPAPEITDGTDVADYFINEKLEQNYFMPDLSQFDLSVPTANSEPGRAQIFDSTTSSGNVRPFRFIHRASGNVEIECGFPSAKNYLEKLIKNENILNLIKKFDICVGELKPMSDG